MSCAFELAHYRELLEAARTGGYRFAFFDRGSEPEPGPLPAGKVTKISGLDRVLKAPGVVQADVFLQEGETIRPVRLDGDRRGYVIATGQTNVQALERAEVAARLLYVETDPV